MWVFFPPFMLVQLSSLCSVNVVSKAYHTRVGKERLQEGRQGDVDRLF
jgi:hypothetical protein